MALAATLNIFLFLSVLAKLLRETVSDWELRVVERGVKKNVDEWQRSNERSEAVMASLMMEKDDTDTDPLHTESLSPLNALSTWMTSSGELLTSFLLIL